MNDKDGLMTVKEVAAFLKVTERTVYRLIKDRRIAATRVGGQHRFSPDYLERWIKQQTSIEGEVRT